MEDPILNRNLAETKELLTRWNQFHDFLMGAMKGTEVTPKMEAKFLELKCRIAMLHDGFIQSLKHDHKTGQNIMSIVNECILLGRETGASEAERQKFEFDWNEAMLLLTEQVSGLEKEVERLAGISESEHNRKRRIELLKARLYNAVHSLYFKFGATVFVLFMLLWGIPGFGIYDYREFGHMDWSRSTYYFVCAHFYRPYISKNWEFLGREEVRENKESPLPANTQPVDAGALTFDYFRNIVLPEVGVDGPELAEVQALADTRVAYWKQRYTFENQDSRFFFLLLKTSEEARQFVTLCNTSLSRKPGPTRTHVLTHAYLGRHANLVALGISHKGFQRDLLWERWHFPNTDNLLGEL